jgi:hypothetical protein
LKIITTRRKNVMIDDLTVFPTTPKAPCTLRVPVH